MATDRIFGVILAGGQGRRMGGTDKALLPFGRGTLLDNAIDRLKPQVAGIVINANGDPERFEQFGLAVVADPAGDLAGPLAGVLAAMRWVAANKPEARMIASVACDTPFFPRDLVERLAAASSGNSGAIALAASFGRAHPVFGLWPVSLARDLEQALNSGTRKVLEWAERHGAVKVAFNGIDVAGWSIDPFFNANTPGELDQASTLLSELSRNH